MRWPQERQEHIDWQDHPHMVLPAHPEATPWSLIHVASVKGWDLDGLTPAFSSLPCISNAGKRAETQPKLTTMGNHERRGAAELS